MHLDDEINARRDAVSGVDPLFVGRWSPRAFDTYRIDRATLERIFDAARWAPSCFNEQPWRFYLSTGETFDDYLALLVDANRAWAGRASLIGFLVGKKYFSKNGKANPSYALDCGAAWMSLALQARLEGLYSHGMAGIKRDEIVDYFRLDPDEEEVLMGFALGRKGDKRLLEPSLQEREIPSRRKPIGDIWNLG